MADTYDFTVDQGSTHSFTLTYTDSAGDAIDLSTYSPQIDVRTGFKNDTGATLLFTLVSGDGIDITNALTGILVVEMSSARTGTMVGNTYRYDLEIKDGADVTRLVQGKITVNKEVTD